MSENKKQFNIYDLSRSFWDFSFENPELIKPIHSAIFFFAIEHCNRLGWKEKFGLPSQMVMEAIGVKHWRTYSEGLEDLINFGFIEMIQNSKNQYSANIVSLQSATAKNDKARVKALDKALQKHGSKQGQSTGQSTVSIDKQLYNYTNIPEREPLQPGLQNSNLFRKPKVPPLNDVKLFFYQNGGTDEMAKKFFDKWEGVGWYYNNSPIVNYSSFAENFILNYKKFEHGKTNSRIIRADPSLEDYRL